LNGGRFDLVVLGDVVTPHGVLRGGGLGVRGSQVAAVWATPPAGFEASDVVDATARWVLPGAIDAHVHSFSAPEEGFTAATRAAAAGGVTTIIEMPYDAGAPVNAAPVLERKIERLEREAVVDVALLGTIRKQGGLDEIDRLAAGGVCGFKVSLFETDPERFPRIEDGELAKAFALIRDVGLTVGVHAEDGEIIYPLIAEYTASQRLYPRAHCETRPPISETASVALALELAAAADVRFHIYHASLPRSFDLVQRYRQQGLRVTAETCPHYLLLSEDDMDRLGPLAKINPPLRSPAAVSDLRRLLANGTVDMVTSDHAPWSRSQKSNPNIFANASGTPGVETLLPLVYSTGVASGDLTIERLAAVLAEGPARAFSLYPRKGGLAVGADADIAILDPSAHWAIDGAQMESTAGWTPYDGLTVQGKVIRTIVRGQTVYDGMSVTGQPGGGTFIRPVAVAAATPVLASGSVSANG